jgi:hypothetical protein
VSEYQYYEFLAVDRPLDRREQAEVRELSSRARITATSFTNEYHWGDFRGDPSRLMERYYDAHLYFANWGTRHLMLRLPLDLLDFDTVERYCVDEYLSAWTTDTHLILSLSSDNDNEEWGEDDLEHALSAIIGVRTELATGDLRPLYLAWLAAYGTWERDEDAFGDEEESELEPPAPAGLGRLTAPQRALADFLRIDEDLLTVAAEASPPAEPEGEPEGLAALISRLPGPEKDELLLRVVRGRAVEVQAALLRRVRADSAQALDDGEPRTVADLLDTAGRLRQERHRRAEAERAAQEALRERERALAREKRTPWPPTRKVPGTASTR